MKKSRINKKVPLKLISSTMKKKGVSEVMGYILLVSFAIFMSFIVYQGLKTYVPAKTLECQEGVSIFIKDASCTYNSTSERYSLKLITKNNGRYNIAGYFIHASTNANQTVATTPLITYLGGMDVEKYENAIILNSGKRSTGGFDNFVSLNEENIVEFNGIPKELFSLDIIPVRFQKEENKLRLVSCGKAILREKISCAS